MFDRHRLYRTSRTPSLRLTSLNVMTSLNATIMSLRYGGCQQMKWLHLLKIYVQKWNVCKKKNLPWLWGVDRKIDTWDVFFYLLLTPIINPFIISQRAHDVYTTSHDHRCNVTHCIDIHDFAPTFMQRCIHDVASSFMCQWAWRCINSCDVLLMILHRRSSRLRIGQIVRHRSTVEQ